MRLASPEQARHIALRAQLLDGSATSVLDTARRLGFLRWAEPSAPADAGSDVAGTLPELANWLGASEIRLGSRSPRAWVPALRAGT